MRGDGDRLRGLEAPEAGLGLLVCREAQHAAAARAGTQETQSLGHRGTVPRAVTTGARDGGLLALHERDTRQSADGSQWAIRPLDAPVSGGSGLLARAVGGG